VRCDQPQPGGGSRLERGLVLLVRLREHVREQRVGVVEVGREPKRKLRVAQLQLAPRQRRDRGARLQLLDRDTELLRDDPQRLHRRLALPSLYPAEIGVRDPGLGKLALGQTPL
jgi:hypothetical protein